MKSRTYTLYEDTGDRYSNGRKKYKQIRRVLKKSPARGSLNYSITSLEDSYNKLIRTKQLEKREWKRYEAVKRVQLSYFGNISLYSLTRELCRDYKNHRLEKGISSATVNLELSILKHIIREARLPCPIDRRLLTSKLPSRERIITPEEQAILFPALGKRARRIAETIVNCGPRPGEACRIKKSSVDLTTNTLHLTETKGLRPRQIPFGPLQRQVFIEAITESPYELIFLNSQGRPYVIQTYDDTFKSTCDRLGIKDLKPHDLRHTFATRLCRSNVNLRKVQYYMGHASIKTTERYTHIDRESREDILIAESFTQNAREIEYRHINRHKSIKDERK